MVEEYSSIIRNDVSDMVSCPKGKSMVSLKWIDKIKHVADGSVEKFKARFVRYRNYSISNRKRNPQGL